MYHPLNTNKNIMFNKLNFKIEFENVLRHFTIFSTTFQIILVYNKK